MTTGKKRTRPITIAGQHFRWRLEFNDKFDRLSVAWAEGRVTTPDRLLVRPEEAPDKLLTVSWPPCSGPIVQPALVKACIEEAIRRGWPAQRTLLDLAGADVPAQR